MIAEITILVVALMLFIISMSLFQGKGKWLIAGYNTLSKEEQKKYAMLPFGVLFVIVIITTLIISGQIISYIT